MKLIRKSNFELNDTLLPDLFILNYMPSMQQNDLKVYIYLLFLLKNSINISEKEIAKKLEITDQELSFCFDRLQSEELILKTEDGYCILDIKEKEIDKSYIPKIETKKTKIQTEEERKRIAAATAINESFFQGIMSLSWYTDISVIFDKYMFSEEVMIALFHYCHEKKALNRNYVYAVAESWYKGGVKSFEELENYLEKIDKIRNIEQKISKALRLNRNITEYEEKYIKKWIIDYKYDFDIIEEALKKTINKSNPTISYTNGILNNWFEKGYKTLEDVQKENKDYEKSFDKKSTTVKKKQLKYKNYEQRDYTKDDLDAYYDNIK